MCGLRWFQRDQGVPLYIVYRTLYNVQTVRPPNTRLNSLDFMARSSVPSTLFLCQLSRVFSSCFVPRSQNSTQICSKKAMICLCKLPICFPVSLRKKTESKLAGNIRTPSTTPANLLSSTNSSSTIISVSLKFKNFTANALEEYSEPFVKLDSEELWSRTVAKHTRWTAEA